MHLLEDVGERAQLVVGRDKPVGWRHWVGWVLILLLVYNTHVDAAKDVGMGLLPADNHGGNDNNYFVGNLNIYSE